MDGSARPGAPFVWTQENLPERVTLGPESVLEGENVFKRFTSRRDDALVIGAGCTLYGPQFAIGEDGRIAVGDACYFTNPIFLCEERIEVGSHVVIGWNATIADTDFHPIAPAERIADAIAVSPGGDGRPRPPVLRKPVVIGDGVWIGPNAAILKGVHLGAGAFIEPGAVVTKDVPPGARVLGNPAQVVRESSP